MRRATAVVWGVLFLLWVSTYGTRGAPTLEEPPRSAHEAVNQPGVMSIGDLLRAQAEYERTMKGPGATDDGPIKALGPGIDCAEKFIRGLRAEGRIDPALITEASREFLVTERGKEWLDDLKKLQADTWFNDAVDGYFVDNLVATLFFVYARKPIDRPRSVRALQLIRKNDAWRVSLDIKEDAELGGPETVAAWKKLQALTEARRKELVALVTRPLMKPLPLDGFYTVHSRQNWVILAFNTRGEVTIYSTDSSKPGASHMDSCEYQIFGDDVVIETRLSPLRLKIDRERSQTVNGRTHYTLILPWPRQLFADGGSEPMLLPPFKREKGALARPERTAEPSAPAEQNGDGTK